ncbi:hypothetical protein ACSSVY_003848 [Roseovarius sp. MBR-51]
MEPTTGLILRRITQTELSVSAHKLATVILDAIAWKEGYNGLSRGTAAFTLSALAVKMGISRQYLTELLGELEASDLELKREKPNVAFSSLFQHVIITLFLDDTGITHIVFQLKASILVPYFSKWQHRRRMAHQIWNFAYR